VTRRWTYLDHPGPVPLAHRGGASDHPENTMAAFAHAVDLGYRYVETDVHATADGRLVAFHDDTLDRVTDARGRLEDLPWSAVARARVGGTEPIPLLEDLLGTWPELRVNLDPKHDAAVLGLAEVLRRTSSYDRVCVAAFSGPRLSRFRQLTGFQVCTALSPPGVARLRLQPRLLPRCLPGVGCVQVPPRWGRIEVVTERFLADAHTRGLAVHTWTVDDAAEMRRLLDLGVDGIITDRPRLLREVLEQRGGWHGP